MSDAGDQAHPELVIYPADDVEDIAELEAIEKQLPQGGKDVA